MALPRGHAGDEAPLDGSLAQHETVRAGSRTGALMAPAARSRPLAGP